MSDQFQRIKALVLDWAGTTIDHGSRAPAIVFQEIFRRREVPISLAQAREPMGRAKRDHIATIAAMPEVAAAWLAAYGRGCGDADIDAMYADFLPLQKSILGDHSHVIPGVPETIAECRHRGLKIGSSTGYTRELMEIVGDAARQQGYQPDCVLCAEDAPRGRPAPYLIYEAAKRLDVFPLWAIVKVDDTPVGIEAGRNAGCWTVGVTLTGNGVGLSVDEVAGLSADERKRVCDEAGEKLKQAGAHYLVESVADLLPVLVEIDNRMLQGEVPINAA